MKNKIVLLTIDSTRRDLEWRMFLASQLAKVGIQSVIMDSTSFRRVNQHSRNCLFLGRVRVDHTLLNSMKKRNTKIFFLHDEGAFYRQGSYAETVKKIYPPVIFAHPLIERIFFWGPKQMNLFADDDSKHKFRISGYPRFDLSRQEYGRLDQMSVKRLQDKYGDYILLCSRFAAANKGTDDHSILGKRMFQVWPYSETKNSNVREAKLNEMFEYWARTTREFSDFVVATAKLAIDFPDQSFLYRPHPAESEAFYKEPFEHFPNLHVSKTGDARSAIRAAKAVIHSECTTSLEAAAMGKPLINFRPQMGYMDDHTVAGVSELGADAHNYNELHLELKNILNGNSNNCTNLSDLKEHVANTPDAPEASGILVKEILEHFETQHEDSFLDMRQLKLLGYYDQVTKMLGTGFRLLHSGTRRSIRHGQNTSDKERKKTDLTPNLMSDLWETFGGNPLNLKHQSGIFFITPDDTD